MTRLCHLLEGPEGAGRRVALDLCRRHGWPVRVLDGLPRATFELLGAGGLAERDFRMALAARARMHERGCL